MGYKKNDKCIQKAFDDERLFVLMTRDATAPRLVIEWIKENLDKQPEAKLREAFECALEMQRRGPDIRDRKMFTQNSEGPVVTALDVYEAHHKAQNPQSESEG